MFLILYSHYYRLSKCIFFIYSSIDLNNFLYFFELYLTKRYSRVSNNWKCNILSLMIDFGNCLLGFFLLILGIVIVIYIIRTKKETGEDTYGVVQ